MKNNEIYVNIEQVINLNSQLDFLKNSITYLENEIKYLRSKINHEEANKSKQ